MEELGFDSILSEEEQEDLFAADPAEEKENQTKGSDDKNPEENKDNTDPSEDGPIDENSLFDNPESVGKGEDKKGTGKPSSAEGAASQQNFYSSLTQALRDEGIFPDLDDDTIKSVVDSGKFRDFFTSQVRAELDEVTARVNRAMEAGIETSEIKRFENTVNWLDKLEDKDLEDDSEDGANLRKKLIYQDAINRGYSQERAVKKVERSFNAQTDIEDAKDALQSNKEHYSSLYNQKIEEAEAQRKEEDRRIAEESENLKKSILEDEKLFGDLVVDKSTRQRIFNNISKPVYKDKETGEYLTEIEKYQKEHRVEFLKNLSLVYTLTNGFKDMGGLIGKKVQKEVSRGFKELENKINMTQRNSDGSLNLLGNSSDENQKVSTFGKDWDLAL